MRSITHLGVGAHSDDLEFMAFHAIEKCFRAGGGTFAGVTCTNGAGSSRKGLHHDLADADLENLRLAEQRAAAVVGRYAAVIQLGFSSADVRSPAPEFVTALREVFGLSAARTVLTHNPADKHDTHVGVFAAVIEALRGLPPDRRPATLLGCEVWRGLDWMPDGEKILLDCSGSPHLAAALNGIFDSQIAGGKRYDLAVVGRQRANATFFDSHAGDTSEAVSFAMDLTPLIRDDTCDPVAFTLDVVDRFRVDVESRLRRAWKNR